MYARHGALLAVIWLGFWHYTDGTDSPAHMFCCCCSFAERVQFFFIIAGERVLKPITALCLYRKTATAATAAASLALGTGAN
jgi:hypothetical protein